MDREYLENLLITVSNLDQGDKAKLKAVEAFKILFPDSIVGHYLIGLTYSIREK